MNWLLDFSTRTALLLSAARAVSLVLRRSSADVRHRLWLLALAGVVLVALPLHFPQQVSISVPARFAFTSSSFDEQHTRIPWTIVWVTGIVLALARLLAGIMAVAFWTRRARAVNQLLVSERAVTPITWGIFRPVILFPPCAEDWSADQRDLAVRHERAHIARRDWLWQTLASTIRAIFWFHPLVWLANSELRREAERAADDLVLASGADPAAYAHQLVLVARNLTAAAPLAAVPMARTPILESRVLEILDPLRNRTRASLATTAALAIFMGACLVPLLALQADSVLPPLPSAGLFTPARFVPVPAPVPPAVIRPTHTPNISVAPPADAATHHMDEPGMQPPRVLYKQEPAYTEDARAARLQGKVVLNVVIDTEGRAREIQVVRSLDAGLDEQAIESIEHWAFAPATRNGQPVNVSATIEVNFRLL